MFRSFRVLLAVLWVAAGYAEAQNYAGPNALGPFRIDADVPMRSLFERLGRASSTTRDIFCYQSQNGKAFLVLTRMVAVYDAKVAGAVTLSSFRNCVNRSAETTTDDLTAWKTEKGIGVSSTADEVRKAYGAPSKEDKIEGAKYRWVIDGDQTNNRYTEKKRPELGDTVLVYRGASDDLRIAEFGIREGKVVWISLSKNE
jgi:hypothetical protein